MTNLIERSEKLGAEVEEMIALESISNQVEAIKTRASQLENVLEKLRLNLSIAYRLKNSTDAIECVTSFSSMEGIRHRLSEYQKQLADNPTFVQQPTDIQLKTLQPIEKYTEDIRVSADSAWKLYVQQQLPIISKELFDALSKVPSLKSRVRNFRDKWQMVGTFSIKAPESDREICRTKELILECRQAWDELDAEEVPNDVMKLLQEATNSQGAQLSRLTPTALSWLDKHELTNNFRIRIR